MAIKKKQKLIPLFTYGTLMKGFPLHEWMGDQKFVCEARLPDYSLLSLGPYPALLRTGNSTDAVNGELYMVEEKLFESLRKMEERVGYRTEDVALDCPDPSGEAPHVAAKAFVFADLQHGEVKWTQTTVKGRQQMYPGSVVAA